MYHADINEKKAGVAILITDKAQFRAKKMTTKRDTTGDEEDRKIIWRNSGPKFSKIR